MVTLNLWKIKVEDVTLEKFIKEQNNTQIKLHFIDFLRAKAKEERNSKWWKFVEEIKKEPLLSWKSDDFIKVWKSFRQNFTF